MRKRTPAGLPAVAAPHIPFMDEIGVDDVGPGDLVHFYNQGTRHGYRLGWVVSAKSVPADSLMIRMKRPGDRPGPPQLVNKKRVMHAYRETTMEDPTDEDT